MALRRHLRRGVALCSEADSTWVEIRPRCSREPAEVIETDEIGDGGHKGASRACLCPLVCVAMTDRVSQGRTGRVVAVE